MPKKPKINSQESTLGPFARAVSEIADDKPADKPAEAASQKSQGAAVTVIAAPESEGEAPPEGDTPQEGG
jgi:hypothetical protein